jgi:hypothetical protein
MARSYMATVRGSAVIVRDVELPDGTEASCPPVEEPVLTEQDLADIHQAEAEYERGAYIPGAQVLQELDERALRRRLEREREAAARPGARVVGPASDGRVRAARRRRA